MSGQVVSVFWRADGSVLFDETAGLGPLDVASRRGVKASAESRSSSQDARPNAGWSTGASSLTPAETGSITAGTVWSLVQVFIQFSREVDGGNVQRLVFREPVQPVGKRRGFGATPANRSAGGQRPILVHVAHDGLFVVTVTETLPPSASQLSPPADDFPATAFSRAVLKYFAALQATFSETSAARASALREGSLGRESANSSSRARSRSNRQTGGSASPYGGTPLIGRNDIQRSYASESSGASFSSSSQSEYFSNESSLSSSVDQPEAPVLEVTPMMPIDDSTVATDIQRILSDCLEATSRI